MLPLLDRPGLQELDVTFLLPRLAWAHLELGDVGDGEEVAQQAVERAWSQRYHLALADALRVQGVGMATTGHQEEAIGVLEKAVALCHAMPYPYAEARALHEWGRIHGARGESGPARERLQAALHIFCRLGARPYIERTEQALAMQR